MATKRERITKDGRRFYEFRCRPSRNEPEHTERWYIQEGWSQKYIDRESDKALADFDRRVHAGEHLTKKAQKAKTAEEAAAAAQKAAEEAKIKTVRQYVDDVFFTNATLGENARSTYEAQLRLHILPYIGEMKITEVTPDDLERVFAIRKSADCAYESMLKLYTVLRSVFKMIYLHKRGNPMLEIQRPQKEIRKEISFTDDNDDILYEQEKVEAYTLEETKRILEVTRNEPLKWRLYISAILDTGIRRGECTALRWSCINFQTGDVLIDRSVGYTKKAGIFFGPPKGGNPRTVTISHGTITMLKEWKSLQESAGIISKYVFTEKNSPKIMFPQTPTKYFREVGKRCGIEHFFPHKLRHTFASLNITEGADIASVSEILGHANKSTTLRIYTHSNGQKKHELSQNFHESIHGKEA